jgi:hypothetical protein
MFTHPAPGFALRLRRVHPSRGKVSLKGNEVIVADGQKQLTPNRLLGKERPSSREIAITPVPFDWEHPLILASGKRVHPKSIPEKDGSEENQRSVQNNDDADRVGSFRAHCRRHCFHCFAPSPHQRAHLHRAISCRLSGSSKSITAFITASRLFSTKRTFKGRGGKRSISSAEGQM